MDKYCAYDIKTLNKQLDEAETELQKKEQAVDNHEKRGRLLRKEYGDLDKEITALKGTILL